jgi:hypothetical protein
MDPQHFPLEHDPATFNMEPQFFPPFCELGLDLGFDRSQLFRQCVEGCGHVTSFRVNLSPEGATERPPAQSIPAPFVWPPRGLAKIPAQHAPEGVNRRKNP